MVSLLLEWKFDFQTLDWKVVIALTALFVTVILAFYFQWWRNRKKLSYEILSNVLLLSAEEEIQDRVEIRFDGKTVKNVRLIVIKLVNDGYQPIKKEDFEKSIWFDFLEANLLSAERVKLNPENLDVETNKFPSKVEIKPALFNRKDYLQFKVLVSDYNGMKIDARIVGVSKVAKVGKRLFSEGIIVSLVMLVTLTVASLYLPSGAFFIPVIAIVLGGTVTHLLVTFKDKV